MFSPAEELCQRLLDARPSNTRAGIVGKQHVTETKSIGGLLVLTGEAWHCTSLSLATLTSCRIEQSNCFQKVSFELFTLFYIVHLVSDLP